MKFSGLTLFASLSVICGQAAAAETSNTVESVTRRGLALVTRAASNWQKNKTCFSCHHQTLPMLAMTEAGRATMVGNAEAMSLYAGTSCEDIRDVPPVSELMERLWNECETSALKVCTAEPGRSAEKTLRP